MSLKEGEESHVATNFSKLTDVEKAKLKTDNHTKLGEHLKMAIMQRVKHTHIEAKSCNEHLPKGT